MDFRQLQYILKVAEERSFSKAAQKLFIAQPSLSQYVQKIELELGVQLFDRSCTPLKLTFAGELYVETAMRILDLKDQLYKQIDDIANSKKGRVTIGLSAFRSTYIMPKVLPLFHDKFPGIEVILVEGNSNELESLALKNISDLTLMTLPIQQDVFDFEYIMSEEILVAIPPNHPIQKRIVQKNINKCIRPVVQLNELRNEPFILLKKDQKLRKIAISLCEQAGFSPRVILESESIEAAHALVTAGMGITFIPEILTLFHRIPPYPLYYSVGESKFYRDLVIAYKKGRYLSVAAKEFIANTKAILSKPEDI